MTDLSTAPASTEVLDAVASAAALLPSPRGWTPAALDRVPPMPPGSRAVEIDLDGGRVALVLTAQAAAHLTAREPIEPVVTPFLAAVAASVFGVPGDRRLDVREVDASAALVAVRQDDALIVGLDGGADLRAFLAVVLSPDASMAFGALPEGATGGPQNPLSVLDDVEMRVSVELGRTRMLVRDILALRMGSVIELDRTAGSPVDVLVNGTLIARGEVIVIDEEYGVRIREVIGHTPEGPKGRR